MKVKGYITKQITLEDVRRDAEMIYYAAWTCWWTHNKNDLYKTDSGIPCDPRGAVLFQTDDVKGFLKATIKDPTYYGKHGLEAFIAAHHANCYTDEMRARHWSFKSWDEYNAILDRQKEFKDE